MKLVVLPLLFPFPELPAVVFDPESALEVDMALLR